MSRYESRIDQAIREAQDRGDFDNLPGSGQPLPDRGELHDGDWWLKQLIEREKLTGLAPASLRLRKEVEDLADTAAKLASEQQVRAYVAEVNTRIDRGRRGQLDGPPVFLPLLSPDDVVDAWRARRSTGRTF